MAAPLQTLIASGTKLWLDSVDPDLVQSNFELGATGATSNPAIISGLIKTGRFDDAIVALIQDGRTDEDIAWAVTDQLVTNAERVFADIHAKSKGNDGYVSFELDPLLEAVDCPLSTQERADRYIELGKQWANGHPNRMIKVPGTPGGLASLEELAAAGVTLNVTLLFTERQYQAARDAVWKGAQQRSSLDGFKSVYSIFVSRVDVYTQQHVPDLIDAAQGLVGIVNAQRLWKDNQQFWSDKNLPLQQEIIFASTGTKDPADSPDKYVAALAGSDIQTNPPSTNDKIQAMEGREFSRMVDQLPPDDVLADIDARVDMVKLESVLMEEGLQKFADPQNALLQLIAEKRASLVS
jgi:transaldolase